MMLQSPPILEAEVGRAEEPQHSGNNNGNREVSVGSTCSREREVSRTSHSYNSEDSDECLVTILAGRLFDSESRSFHTEQAIEVDSRAGLIVQVRPIDQKDIQALQSERFFGRKANQGSNNIIDLRKQTILPGFVDVHVHLFLHPYSEVPWDDQVTKETIVERTIRAVNHARTTLLAGFTTVRDLGTEGAGDADITLRRCLSGADALAAGPRFFTANRALVPTGAYGAPENPCFAKYYISLTAGILRSFGGFRTWCLLVPPATWGCPKSSLHPNEDGVEGITGAEVADGVEGCRIAVRRQVGAGADWIKIYADYRVRSRISDISRSVSAAALETFQDDELTSLIDTAHFYGLRVAAHAATASAMRRVAERGVDSIEHGHSCHDRTVFELMEKNNVVFVPTLGAYYTVGRGEGRSGSGGSWAGAQRAFNLAREANVDIAVGGDTGVFSHGDNSLEMQLMARLGAAPKDILAWATYGGWKCVRPIQWEEALAHIEEGLANKNTSGRIGRAELGDNALPFGVLRAGFAADIIATSGDLEENFESAITPNSITFVMKMGRIQKQEGLSKI